jgi:para-aminobenzoate synthetase/4-amino-4-deoxychorismate lyase
MLGAGPTEAPGCETASRRGATPVGERQRRGPARRRAAGEDVRVPAAVTPTPVAPRSVSAAGGAERVRPVRVPLEGSVPAAHAALLVRDDADPLALAGRWAGSRAIVASEPVWHLSDDGDPFAVLDDLPAVDDAPEGFVGGGWFGMLGYGLGRRIEAVGAPPPAAPGERLPAAVLRFYDHLLRLDADGVWWFEALWTEARAAALERRLELLRGRLRRGAGASRRPAMGRWRPSPSPEGHARAVAACRERIAEGDLFQANLALRLRAPIEGDAVDLFVRGITALAPDRAAWLAGPWGAAASLSPELLVAARGRRVRSAPIKGTRPRPPDAARAEEQRAALTGSAKDRAENVMIVDLVRNDLGRVCEPGSVRVAALADVRAHAGVWHLVSEVEGRLRPDIGHGALVRAVFPPGSVTGAPKVAAMDVVSELEGVPRQAFCGAFGFASPTAGLELSVAIRTFEVRDGQAWLDVGGGVVADSDPDAEAAECLAKAAPLLAAVGGELDAGGVLAGKGDAPEAAPLRPPPPPAAHTKASGSAAIPVPRRSGPRPTPRPDPEQGIFESIRVVDGVAVAGPRHLARMAASARELYGVELPSALGALVEHTALEQGGPCRLRVLLDPDGTVALDVAPPPSTAATVAVEPVGLAGGLGAHKWRDRRLIAALDADTTPAVPLLVDLDGLLLETTRASVLAVVGGVLVTPPLDGRILPGVTRARVLEHAAATGVEVAERPLRLDELRGADAAFAVNALRGLEVIDAVGDAALPRDHELARRLAGHLAAARR